jgi:dTDP-4-amino-4,6-dideoxygalactose transaminase
LGDAALFSFQTLKPLNTFGGGMAIVRDAAIRARVRASVEAERWPTEGGIKKRLLRAWFERTFMRPGVFTFSGFPILWLSSFLDAKPDVLLWERIRPLDVLPSAYTERYSNVQAAIGLAALTKLDEWTARTRRHASILDAALGDITRIPTVPSGCEHVYYQYCIYARDRDDFVKQAIRRQVDVETLHMDVCTRLDLFKNFCSSAPGADQASKAVQLPVYESLSDDDVGFVARVTREILENKTASSLTARSA